MTITKIIKCNICRAYCEIGPTEFYPHGWKLIHIYNPALIDKEHPERTVAGQEYDFAVCPQHDTANFIFTDEAVGIFDPMSDDSED